MKTTRCSQCGNEIPAWSGGVCPVCERVSQGEKRFWKEGIKRPRRSRQRPPSATGKPAHSAPAAHTRLPKAKSETAARRQKTSVRPLGRRTRGRRRLDGFNRFLRDVYGDPMHFNHLLTKQGISHDQVNRWRQDGIWLLRFLRRLKQELQKALAKVKPRHNPQVLTLWYGLDGKGARSLDTIADEMRMTTQKVLGTRQELLMYLWREDGQMALEEMILATAQETEKSYRRKKR